MKRKQIIRRLAAEVASLEALADEAAGFGFYGDAASWQGQAHGVRYTLALLDPECRFVPAGEDRWHHSQPHLGDPSHVHDTDAGGNCRTKACTYNSDAEGDAYLAELDEMQMEVGPIEVTDAERPHLENWAPGTRAWYRANDPDRSGLTVTAHRLGYTQDDGS